MKIRRRGGSVGHVYFGLVRYSGRLQGSLGQLVPPCGGDKTLGTGDDGDDDNREIYAPVAFHHRLQETLKTSKLNCML